MKKLIKKFKEEIYNQVNKSTNDVMYKKITSNSNLILSYTKLSTDLQLTRLPIGQSQKTRNPLAAEDI